MVALADKSEFLRHPRARPHCKRPR